MALVLLCVTLSLLCVFCVSAEYGPCTAFFVLFFFSLSYVFSLYNIGIRMFVSLCLFAVLK